MSRSGPSARAASTTRVSAPRAHHCHQARVMGKPTMAMGRSGLRRPASPATMAMARRYEGEGHQDIGERMMRTRPSHVVAGEEPRLTAMSIAAPLVPTPASADRRPQTRGSESGPIVGPGDAGRAGLEPARGPPRRIGSGSQARDERGDDSRAMAATADRGHRLRRSAEPISELDLRSSRATTL